MGSESNQRRSSSSQPFPVSGHFSRFSLFLLAVVSASGQTGVSASLYNVKGDGVTNDGPALQRALTSGNSIYVPPGTYLVDNSAGPLSINNFSASLQFSSLAEIVCNTPSKACLVFTGGSNPSFLNLHISYTVVPTNDCRGGETLCVTLMFDGQTNPVIQGTLVENAWAIGVSVNNTYNARVLNTTIRHSTRDGLFLQDNQNISVDTVVVSDAGDDCLGFHSTTVGSGRNGGTASSITCVSTRGAGIAFAGGTNLSVSDFVINGTSAQGIYFMSDPSQNYGVPGNITLAHGVVRGVGTVADAINRKGTQHGIQYYTNGGPNIGPLQFTDIVIDSVNGYGIYGLNAQSVSLNDVHVSNSGLDGATSNGSCAQFVWNGSVALSKFSARGCYRTGVLAIQNTSLSIDTATVTDAWKKGALESGAKAFDLVSNGSIRINSVNIVDNSDPATGYTFSESQNGSGAVSGVSGLIRFGALKLIHGSPSVSFQQ
jgi:Pectate lyase superfamily protein